MEVEFKGMTIGGHAQVFEVTQVIEGLCDELGSILWGPEWPSINPHLPKPEQEPWRKAGIC